MNRSRRYHRFLQRLEQLELDEFLVTHPPNLLYLFGFTGSSGAAYIDRGQSTLLVDSRYLEQAQAEVQITEVQLTEAPLNVELQALLEASAPSSRTIGFEAQHLSHRRALELMSADANRRWMASDGVVEQLRMIKDDTEISTLRSALRRASEAYQKAKAHFAPGMTELEIAGRIELEMRRAGGSGTAFDTIVASGPRSSHPHGVASSRVVSPLDYLLIDFGIRYAAYNSDQTRLFFFPTSRIPMEILTIVRGAQAAALDCIRPGVPAAEIDKAARKRIQQGGYADYFGHSTGHGLGLEVHELPHISHRDQTVLQPGMVFTVEPGIYLPGQYGVRIEDVAVVTEGGYELLSTPDPLTPGS